MAFHRYLGVTFICTVAFHRLALDRRGNILGGIIGIHPLVFDLYMNPVLSKVALWTA